MPQHLKRVEKWVFWDNSWTTQMNVLIDDTKGKGGIRNYTYQQVGVGPIICYWRVLSGLQVHQVGRLLLRDAKLELLGPRNSVEPEEDPDKNKNS
jgi:hypothetical protein